MTFPADTSAGEGAGPPPPAAPQAAPPAAAPRAPELPRPRGERNWRLAKARDALARNAHRPPPPAPVDPDRRDPSSRWYQPTPDELEAEEQYMREAVAVVHFDELERHADHASWGAEPRCPNCGAHTAADPCPLCGGPTP